MKTGFSIRLNKIKKYLTLEGVDGILITDISHITYLTGYSGFSIEEREAYLLITKRSQYIFTDARYSEAIITDVKHFELQEISGETPFKTLIEQLIKKHSLTTIGFDENDLSVSEYNKLKKIFKKLRPIDLSDLRIIKDSEESQFITASCQLGDEAFDYILGKIKPGITEKELALELELFIKKHGGTLSFDTIIAFGANSSIPHYLTNNQRLKTNDLILMDFGVKKNNYCSDMTRCVVFGKADKKTKKIYNTVLESNKRAIEFLNHKSSIVNQRIKASEVDKVAREYIVSRGFPTIPHSLGHGVGVQVHEEPRLSPNSKDLLKPGMIFSIEPGIYDLSWGGVRIEDLVCLKPNSIEVLTNAPKELIEL